MLDPGLDLISEDFIRQCLKKEPCERKNVRQLLQHPFIKRYDTENINSQFVSQISQLQGIDEKVLPISNIKFDIETSKWDFSKKKEVEKIMLIHKNKKLLTPAQSQQLDRIVLDIVKVSFLKSCMIGNTKS